MAYASATVVREETPKVVGLAEGKLQMSHSNVKPWKKFIDQGLISGEEKWQCNGVFSSFR